MSGTSKALVLLSGGIDSTTCLMIARRDHGYVEAISMDYGQRHSKEIGCAARVCDELNVRHRVHRLGKQPDSMLTDAKQDVPDVSYNDLPEGQSPTYVHFRNGLMLSQMAAIATSEKFDAIYFGAHSEDAANWAYPDCTPEFIGAMANAIHVGTYFKVRLYTPLQWLDKKSIIRLGSVLSAPYHLTWSCYKGGDIHCGVCPTCRSRREGFRDAKVIDPTAYARTE